jgi:hypothetical protein
MNELLLIIFYVINFYLYKRFNNFSKKEIQADCCSICLEDILQDKITTFECNHKFHLSCLNQWVAKSHTCPQCRAKLNVVYKLKINDTRRMLRHM